MTFNEAADFVADKGFIYVDIEPSEKTTAILQSVLNAVFPEDSSKVKPMVGKSYGVMDSDARKWNSTYTKKEKSINLSDLTPAIDHYEIIKLFPTISQELKIGDKVTGAVWEAQKFPEYFKPVYAPQTIILMLGTEKNVRVHIRDGQITSSMHTWELSFFEEIYKEYTEKGMYNNFTVGVTQIHIGCKIFSLEDIKLIIDTAKL